MNIVFFTESYAPQQTGVARCVSLEAEELEKLGHRVYIVTPGKKVRGEDTSKILRVPTLNFGALKKNNQHVGIPMPPTISAFLSNVNVDIVHCHTELFLGWAAQAWADSNRVPFVHTTHTQWSEYWESYLSSFVPKKAFDLMLRSFYEKCDLIISPSVKGVKILEGIGIEVPIEHLANASTYAGFFGEKFDLRVKYGFGTDDVILITVGRLGEEKRVMASSEVVAKVMQVNPNVKMIFVGDGPQNEELRNVFLERGLSDRVTFTGFVENDVARQYLLMGDVYITASISEMHSISVLEALNSSLAIVTRRDISFDDTVIAGYNGQQLETDEDMAAYLEDLTQDRDRMLEYGRNALALSANFSPWHHTTRLLELYQKASDGH